MPSASSRVAVERPSCAEAAAQALSAAAEDGRRVRILGGGTKLERGYPVEEPDLELSTAALDGLVEHNRGDLTAVVQAGLPVARAQEAFAAAGQMLSLDPPEAERATVGGLVATGDSGPMRHRFGAVRDLILGITVALPDGSVARAGGRVIKNVAGYDLAKLFCGSYGTLGLIVEAVFRLHPAPAATATAVGRVGTPRALAQAAAATAAAPLELRCLDVAWHRGGGTVLARAGGSAAHESAEAAGRRLGAAGARVELIDDDEWIWREQRSGQRAVAGGAVVRVSGVATQLPDVVEAAQALDADLVGRAALGLNWLALAPRDPAEMAAAVDALRARLAPGHCTLLDAPEAVRALVDPWGVSEGPELTLARRLKARFDPGGTCNPGVYVGGL